MKVRVLIFCLGCVLVMGTTATAAEQAEAPAILSALGTQAGVTVVSEAHLAEIEGTGPFDFWTRQWRVRLRTFFRARRARRRAIIRARIAAWRGGGVGDTTNPGTDPGDGGGVFEPVE